MEVIYERDGFSVYDKWEDGKVYVYDHENKRGGYCEVNDIDIDIPWYGSITIVSEEISGYDNAFRR